MVFMTFEDTHHYSINTTISEFEWNTTLPAEGAVVFLGPHRRPFTVSVFHQLRCLNIVRMAILQVHQGVLLGSRGDGGELVNHCMNYLRQMVLCRTDTTLETVRATTGRRSGISHILAKTGKLYTKQQKRMPWSTGDRLKIRSLEG